MKGNGNRVTVAVVDPSAGIDPRLPVFHVVTFEAKVIEEPGLPLMALTLNGGDPPRDLIVEALGAFRNDLDLLRKPLKLDVRPVGNVAVPPHSYTLAVALLLRSVILGDRLDEGLVAAATVNVKQDPDLKLYRLYGYPSVNLEAILAAGFSKVVIPDAVGGLVDDYAVRGEWASVHGSQVWTAGAIEELYDLLVVEDEESASENPAAGAKGDAEVPRPDPEEVAQRFEDTQALLLERGMSMAANPHVMERVSKMLELHPDHHTANLYRRYGEGAPPKHLSLIGSAEGLRAFFYREVMPVFRDLTNLSDSDVRDKKRVLRERFTEVSKDVHPEAVGVVNHLDKFEEFITRFHQVDAASIQKTATEFDAWRKLLDEKVDGIAAFGSDLSGDRHSN